MWPLSCLLLSRGEEGSTGPCCGLDGSAVLRARLLLVWLLLWLPLPLLAPTPSAGPELSAGSCWPSVARWRVTWCMTATQEQKPHDSNSRSICTDSRQSAQQRRCCSCPTTHAPPLPTTYRKQHSLKSSAIRMGLVLTAQYCCACKGLRTTEVRRLLAWMHACMHA